MDVLESGVRDETLLAQADARDVVKCDICRPVQDRAGWKSCAASDHAGEVVLSCLSSSRMMRIISGGRILQLGNALLVRALLEIRLAD